MAFDDMVSGGAAKSNYEGSSALYDKKFAFKGYLLGQNKSLGVKNIVDFNTGEKLFYGRMNYESMPIALRTHARLKAITFSENSNQPARVLPFVADLFNEMVNVFNKAMAQNQISSATPYLSSLKAYRGAQLPGAQFNNYKNLLLPTIGKKIRDSRPTFTTLDQFIPFFIENYKDFLGTMPLTYSTFIKSRRTSVMCSGLAIEVADLNHFDDSKKIADFVESPNWSFFVNVCNNHGFMIDAHAPFRIVADLNSSIMIERSAVYGYGSVKALFQKEYSLAIILSIRNLVRDLAQIYKHATAGTPVMETVICDGNIINRPIATKSYTPREVNSVFSVEGLIMTYCTIKLAEVRPTMDIIEKQNLLRDVRDLYYAYNSLTVPLIYFEEIISKTFDSINSFSYYKKNAGAIIQALIESGAIQSIEEDMVFEQSSTGNVMGASARRPAGGSTGGGGGY